MNILNKLTVKHLKMNRKRTIVSIIGIILSTALMVGVGLLLSTYREASIQYIIENEGSYNTVFTNIKYDKLKLLENNSSIKKVYYKNDMGYSYIKYENYKYKEKPYYHLYGVSKEYYKTLELIKGRLPENDNEIVISDYINNHGKLNLKIGDVLTLSLGERYLDDTLYTEAYYKQGETLKVTNTKNYSIVGIVKRDVLESKISPGYDIFTNISNDSDNSCIVYVEYNKVEKSYELGEKLTISLGSTQFEENNDDYNTYSISHYNDKLISLYGVSKYSNIYQGLVNLLIIILSLVAIACVIVIYNSFAISVMERKKQFGLLSSIGATKKQIRKTVIFEAIIVSVIGIPLGILSAYIGIGVVIAVMNSMISSMINMSFKLCTYPIFIIIPVIFMIITVFVSALLPVLKASKISPIEAIRLNDDIKIKGKKVNSPAILRKIFGMEGDIAYKNMKRNKKKYRITVISLFISIVLFVSFSGFMIYAMQGSQEYLGTYDFDAQLRYDNNPEQLATIVNSEYVKEYQSYKTGLFSTGDTKFGTLYTDNYKKFLKDLNKVEDNSITVVVFTDDEFNKYIKEIGKKNVKPVLYNKFSEIVYYENTRKSYNMNKYYENLKINPVIHLEHSFWNDDNYNKDLENYNGEREPISDLKDYYVSSKKFFGSSLYEHYEHPVLIISDTLASFYGFDKYDDLFSKKTIIKAVNNDKYDEYMKNLENNNNLQDFIYQNFTTETKQYKNLVFIIKLLVYGFITLVTLIGITSVFNTINTSISLRRKEFAVLRSVGLTPNGFKRMLLFESLFFGVKSLIYALPVSVGIIYLIGTSIEDVVSLDHLLLPWDNILFAVIGVFIIIFISMTYATNKIKDENILDAIRQENI